MTGSALIARGALGQLGEALTSLSELLFRLSTLSPFHSHRLAQLHLHVCVAELGFLVTHMEERVSRAPGLGSVDLAGGWLG
jgi:hypothetical protein